MAKKASKSRGELCANCLKKLGSKTVTKNELKFCCQKCCDVNTKKQETAVCEFC